MTGHQSRFAALAGTDLLHAIRTIGRETGFAQGEQIQSAGTWHPYEPILLIETGFISTAATAPGRRRTPLSLNGPGDLAGEHALLGSSRQTHGLVMTGMTKGRGWSVHPGRLQQVLDDYPHGWEALARHQHDQVAAAWKQIWLMANEAAGRRLAVFLLQLLSYNQPPKAHYGPAQWVPLQLSQNELAEWIGASRETVARVLRGWVRRGVMQTGRRQLLVQDVPMLEKIAGESWDNTIKAA